jgi:SecD/SecF fusion protein
LAWPVPSEIGDSLGTSLALFLATAPLAVFGGPALQQFAITLLFGLLLESVV